MSEKSQIVFMQARLIRLAAKKWNTDIQKASSLLSQYGLLKLIEDGFEMCIRDSHGVAVLQYAAQLEADEIGIMSLGDQFRRRGALVVLGVLGAPLAVAVADAAGVEHGHHLVLSAGGLLVAGCGDVEEGSAFQRLQHGNIPLTGDEE